LGSVAAAFPSVDVQWLNTGHGEMLKKETENPSKVSSEESITKRRAPETLASYEYHRTRLVTIYEPTSVEVSAGDGGLIPLGEIASTDVDIPSFVLRRILDRTTLPDSLGAIVVRGDSMEPEVKHGDIVFFERCDQIEDAGRYIIRLDGGISLKKVQRRGGHVYRIIPANPDYDHEDIQQQGDTWVSLDSGASVDFDVVGRFLGVLQPVDLDAPMRMLYAIIKKNGGPSGE
jgi:phage repressor protein C with HTH and peptisase S24 domain